MNVAIQVVGIVGALLLLLAYWGISSGTVFVKSAKYQILNFFGALAVAINAGYFSAYGPLVLNIIWCVLAIRNLARYRRRGA